MLVPYSFVLHFRSIYSVYEDIGVAVVVDLVCDVVMWYIAAYSDL